MLELTEIHEIELELTGICNLSCPLCARNNPAAKHLLVKNHRPIEEVVKQIESFVNLKRICLAGIISEPTLYKDFNILIEYLGTRKDLSIELYTNASTHKTNWWKKLGEIFPDNIKIYIQLSGHSGNDGVIRNIAWKVKPYIDTLFGQLFIFAQKLHHFFIRS